MLRGTPRRVFLRREFCRYWSAIVFGLVLVLISVQPVLHVKFAIRTRAN